MKIAGAATLFATGLALLPTMAMSNDFSTVTRVHFVMDCMEANPKMNVGPWQNTTIEHDDKFQWGLKVNC